MDNKHVQKKDWNLYISYLDDYLIQGHTDKYRLSKKMIELKYHIEKYIEDIKKEKEFM